MAAGAQPGWPRPYGRRRRHTSRKSCDKKCDSLFCLVKPCFSLLATTPVTLSIFKSVTLKAQVDAGFRGIVTLLEPDTNPMAISVATSSSHTCSAYKVSGVAKKCDWGFLALQKAASTCSNACHTFCHTFNPQKCDGQKPQVRGLRAVTLSRQKCDSRSGTGEARPTVTKITIAAFRCESALLRVLER